MKKISVNPFLLFLFDMIILISILTPLYASYQYFYTDKFYERIVSIHFIEKQVRYIPKRRQISSDIYETYSIPQNIYIYDILTDYIDHKIYCLRKIDFSKLKDNTNLMKMFNCKLIK